MNRSELQSVANQGRGAQSWSKFSHFYRPQGEGNVFTGVRLSTIGLMATRSLLGLITALSLRILLECFLVIHFSAKIVINSRLTHRDPPLFTNLNIVTLLNSPSVVQFFGGEGGWDGVIS